MSKEEKICPILKIGENRYVNNCMKEQCEWWIPFAHQCAVTLVAGILADSTICQNVFDDGAWVKEDGLYGFSCPVCGNRVVFETQFCDKCVTKLEDE